MTPFIKGYIKKFGLYWRATFKARKNTVMLDVYKSCFPLLCEEWMWKWVGLGHVVESGAYMRCW